MGFFDSFLKKKETEVVDAQEEKSQTVVEDKEVSDEPHIKIQTEDYKEQPELDQLTLKPIKTYAEKKPVDHVIGKTRIFAIINQKGGVGKSTTAINLGATLGEKGKQVLLVDLDPQGNTTTGLAIDKSQLSQCTYDVLTQQIPITDIIIPDIYDGVDLAPATINVAGAEMELVSAMARENRLKNALDSLRGKYDYILIDCPPALGLLTLNALVAADRLFIPIQCEYYALEGVTKLLGTMQDVKQQLNPSLDIFGVLLTMTQHKTMLSRDVAREVRAEFGDLVFDAEIPRSIKITEAPGFGKTIIEHDPNGRGAQAYRALAEEVIARG